LPLDLPPAKLPIAPYTFGAWLGDGTSENSSVTNAYIDSQIISEIGADGYEVVEWKTASESCGLFGIKGLKPKLRDLGVLGRGLKRIPDVYKRASFSQRLALLQGLLDTDGGWSGSQVELSLSNEWLSNDAYELIVSLGMIATRSSRRPKLNGVECATSYRIRFTPTLPVFRLARKLAKWRVDSSQQQRRFYRYIESVVPVPSVKMRCITVDSPSALYLVGESMIPTHNTNLARVIAEEMCRAGQQFVAVDPVGSWYGLRSSRDGQSTGLPIPIFGGDHGDVPIEPDSGNMVASLITDRRLSCVVDVSDFNEADRIKFLSDFGNRLYRTNRNPLHLFLEECDDYLPQRPFKDQARLLRVFETIVRRGRSRGLGITMITQRSASVNKSVLTQIENLFVLRTTSPQDRKAIAAWVEYHGESDKLLESLQSLDSGEAWLWSPSWMKTTVRFKARLCDTFDSGATPSNGSTVAPAAGTLADVDIEGLRAALSETIERVQESDPVELRLKIEELRRQLASRPLVAPAPPPQKIEVRVPVLEPHELELLLEIKEALAKASLEVSRLGLSIENVFSKLKTQAESDPEVSVESSAGKEIVLGGDIKLDKMCRKALAAFYQIGPENFMSMTELSIRTGYKPDGGLKNALYKLKGRGLVEFGVDDLSGSYRGTVLGRTVAEAEGEKMPDDLFQFWLEHKSINKMDRTVLELLRATPEGLSSDAIADRSGYMRSGGIKNSVSKLRGLGLIVGKNSEQMKLSQVLLEERF
jgi:hypothetical protein